jgi:hypothetical protein
MKADLLDINLYFAGIRFSELIHIKANAWASAFFNNMKDAAAFLYEKADQLLRLFKHIRTKGIGPEDLCLELETVANELMRKAVELSESGNRRARQVQ